MADKKKNLEGCFPQEDSCKEARSNEAVYGRIEKYVIVTLLSVKAWEGFIMRERRYEDAKIDYPSQP